MTESELKLASELQAANIKIETLDKELYGLMLITSAILGQVFPDPERILNSLRDSTRDADEIAAIDAVSDLVAIARGAPSPH